MLTIFFNNPRLLILSMGLILVAGFVSLAVTPRMEDPLLTPRAGTITTFLPGADAERVEALVTEKIEEELKEIEEIKEVRSSSRAAVSFIAIELRDEVDEAEALTVWSRVRDKADDAIPNLPPGASKPEFEQLDVKAYALIVGLRWDRADRPSYGIMRRLLKQLKDRLDSLSGTEKSEIVGDVSEEILVTVHPETATAINLNAMDLARQIEASDAKVSAGQLRSDRREILLEVSGELDTLTRVSKIPIQFGSASNFVSLSDIATIEKTVQDPPAAKVIAKDQAALALAVLVRPDFRLDRWSAEVAPILADFEAQLPNGLAFEIIFEQNRYVNDRMSTLFSNLWFGALAIFVVVCLMMGFRSAIIISSSLPLGCLMVLACMQWFGIPIHQMSVTGLIIALGLMIDNAIVMVDEVYMRLVAGKSRNEAISDATRYLAVPLLGSTLTTVLSFGPIALMPGPAGEFVGSIALVTIIAIVATLILSLTVVSALAAFGLTPNRDERWYSRGITLNHGAKIYKALLGFAYRHPWATVNTSIATAVLGGMTFLRLPEQFFPPADRAQFHLELELPVATSLEETRALASKIRDRLLGSEGVRDVTWFLGESAPVFYYNLIPERKNTPSYGQAIVNCVDGANVRDVILRTQTMLDVAFPQATCLARQLEQGPPFSAPIEIRFFGPDTDKLRELGESIRLTMSQTPDVILSRSELSDVLPKITFAVDEQQIRLAGLSNRDVASALNDALEGTQGGSIVEATEELPVRVRVSSDRRADVNKIASLDIVLPQSPMNTVTGESVDYRAVPISAISQLKLDAEANGIARLNGQRMNEVQAFITAGVLPSTVLANIQSRMAAQGFALPNGYTMSYGGAEAERDDAVGNLIANAIILLSLMIATLVLSLRSFRLAALIWAIAGLSVGYSFGGLYAFGYPWGFMSIVGIMGMIGVAVNDSIVVLTSLCTLPPEKRTDVTSVVDLVIHNTRHVLATTFTTIVGFVPLIIGGGDFWPPVAICISVGVGGATALALYFIPAAFILLHRSSTAKYSL